MNDLGLGRTALRFDLAADSEKHLPLLNLPLQILPLPKYNLIISAESNKIKA
jgi:hypothetical protein